MKKTSIFGIIASSTLLLAGVSAYTIALNAQSKVKVARAATTATVGSISNVYGGQYMSINLDPFDTTVFSNAEDITKWTATDGVLTVTTNNLNNFLIAHGNGAGGNIVVGTELHDKYVGNSGVANYGITYLNIDFYVGDNLLTTWKFGNPPAADTITVSPTSAEVMVGKTLNISANTSSEITWSSSVPSVATVAEKQDDNKTGVVTAIATGETVITARISETVAATCTVTVVEHETIKLSTPVGVVLNQIGDGGKLVAFAPVDHASSYKAVFHGQDSSVVESAITNGGRLDSAWSGLTNGMYYDVGIVAVGDGVDYSDSDESALASTKFLCMKSGYTYAQFFLNATNVCDYDGKTFNITKTIWDELKAKYDQLFYNQRKSLKDGTTESEQDAIARYNYILTKYSETEYDWLVDFIDTGARNPSSSNNNTVMNITNSSTTLTTIIVACLAVVSFAGVATFLAVKKRKHQ